jgi:hypothetical protein
MNQCWSAEAPSQETTNTEGTTKLSRAKDDSSISQQAKKLPRDASNSNHALSRSGDKRFSLMKRWFYRIIGFDSAPQIQEGNKNVV